MLSVAPSVDAKQTTEVSTSVPVPKLEQINNQKQKPCDAFEDDSISISLSNQTTHIFKSKLPDIPISNHLPLHTYCFENLSEFADRPCLIVAATGKTYTYAETYLQCQKNRGWFVQIRHPERRCNHDSSTKLS